MRKNSLFSDGLRFWDAAAVQFVFCDGAREFDSGGATELKVPNIRSGLLIPLF